MTTGELFLAIEEWGKERNIISPENRGRQALKVMEEVGETMAALARGNRAELKDGIGDSIVTLIILAAQSGLSAHDCLHSAYNEIKDRKGKTVDGVFIKVMRAFLIELYGDHDEEGLLFADGFDDAIIGICPNSLRIVYSRSKVIEILSEDMSTEDAVDYAEYNTFNAYVGEKTPIWVEDLRW